MDFTPREKEYRVWDGHVFRYSTDYEELGDVVNDRFNVGNLGDFFKDNDYFNVTERTGLYDSQGAKIREGDIVDGLYTSVVFFWQGSYCVNISDSEWIEISQCGGFDDMKVVGNVFQDLSD